MVIYILKRIFALSEIFGVLHIETRFTAEKRSLYVLRACTKKFVQDCVPMAEKKEDQKKQLDRE